MVVEAVEVALDPVEHRDASLSVSSSGTESGFFPGEVAVEEGLESAGSLCSALLGGKFPQKPGQEDLSG